MEDKRSLTRLSLYYLAGYLTLGGLGLVVAPRTALGLMLAAGNYGEAMPRLAGTLMLALGLLVVQIIRHRVDVLHKSTVLARAVILPCLGWLYATSRIRCFSFSSALGFVLTGAGYFVDSRA